MDKKKNHLGSTCECNTSMQIYEKFVFRGIEVQFFSRTAVKFELNRVYEFIGEVTENRPFWDVLAYKLVGVLDQAFLPGGIRVCEIDFGIQFLGNALMLGEFRSVVGGDGVHHGLVGQQQVDDGVGHRFRVFPLG